jgi:hypothetical protein
MVIYLKEIKIIKNDLRDFLVSRIINENSAADFEELLKKKELNGQNWSLLYRGTRNGFRASDFHYHCDDKPNTLTIVQTTNGNIFGGFTSAQWISTKPSEFNVLYDNRAFIYSLVNKENRPLIFEHSSSDNESICRALFFGPIFGSGFDLVICNCSNTNTTSYSDLGKTFTHPEYPYNTEKAKTILAGSRSFQVQEIEVFQIQ